MLGSIGVVFHSSLVDCFLTLVFAAQLQSGDYKDLLELMLLARDGTSDRKLSEKVRAVF